MLIQEMRSGEKVFLRDDTLIVYFSGPRRVVSTSRINGGLREDLQVIFNHHMPPDKHDPADLPGGSVEGYLEYLCNKLKLPVCHTAGLLTAANMENAAIKSVKFRELEVTAIATAGVDVNGGRAGDPARHYELNGKWSYLGGTINIILFIDGNLPPYTLVRSIVTATEAKAAALAELMAPSRYSCGIATGSGTDQIIAVSNIQSPYCFSDAGKHSKLGELIGVMVKEAVKYALEKQTGLNPERQRSFLARFDRYGVSLEDFWRQAEENGIKIEREAYLKHLRLLDRDTELVALAAGLIHLLDEYKWGLLSSKTVIEVGVGFVNSFLEKQKIFSEKKEDPVSNLARLFIRAVNEIITKSI